MFIIDKFKQLRKNRKKRRLLAEFSTLINENDNFKLCSGICSIMLNLNLLRPKNVDEPELSRIITMICHSRGVIGNGNFQYLFEHVYDDDPHFKLTAEAYKAVGAMQEYDVFQKVFALYPNNTIPAEMERRLDVWEELPEEMQDSISDEYFAGGLESVGNKLAPFIKENATEIRNLIETA